MLDIYSYRKTPQEIKETKLDKDEINLIKMKMKDFEKNMKLYIKSYNSLCDITLEKSFFLDEDYMNKPIELFLINENNNNNQLNYIFDNFINYQNDFVSQISGKYFINNNIKEIKVQEATKENIPRFCSSDDEFLNILIKNTLMKNNNEIFDFDLEEIENDLEEKIIPGLKKFIIGKIKKMKYNGEPINDEIIDDFQERYKPEELNEEQKDFIKEFYEGNEENKNKDFLKALKSFMFFIMTKKDYDSDTKIQDIISNQLDKNINFNKKEIDLINIFFNGDLNEDNIDGDLDEMNANNIVFSVNNLYPLYIEIVEKYIKN